MAMTVNQKWVDKMQRNIFQGKMIDETISFNKTSQWLITMLDKYKIPFKIYNLGAGVKRITTETDICPCCKKKI